MNVRRRAMQTAIALVFPAVLSIAGAPGSALPVEYRPAVIAGEDTALEVEIIGVEPLVLTGTENATITAAVSNRTSEQINDAQVELRAQGWTPNSRSSLLRWLESDRYLAALSLGSASIESLSPGASTTITFDIPASDFRFNTWGPRGIEVSVSAAGLPTVDARSFVLWWDEPTVLPTRVGILAPVAHTATELTTQSTMRTSDLITLEGSPGLTLVVDPSVNSVSLDASARLPWKDADPEALLTHAPDLYAEAVERSSRSGVPTVSWIEYPSDAILEAAADLGDAAIVPSSAVVTADNLTYTPHTLITTDPLPIVVTDDGLSEVISGTITVEEDSIALNDVERRQLFAATTAVITRERPFEARTILASSPWDWTSEDADVAEVMESIPWIIPVTLDDVLQEPAVEGVVSLSGEAAMPDGAIPAEDLARIGSVTEALRDAATLSPDISARVTPTRISLDSLLSRALRTDPAARTRYIERAEWMADFYLQRVAVTGPAEVNMISTESEFPVMVSNDLPHTVTVTVSLTPTDPRLSSPGTVEAEIPAATTTRVMVPVHGVGWGDFEAIATISTSSGYDLSEPFIIDVRLRANWEDWGLIGIITLAVAALVFGIWRTVRRNRRIQRSVIIGAAAEELDVILEAERADEEPRTEAP